MRRGEVGGEEAAVLRVQLLFAKLAAGVVQVLHREQVLLQRCLLAPVDNRFEIVSPLGLGFRHNVVDESLHALQQGDLGEARTDVLVGGADLEERKAYSIGWMVGMMSFELPNGVLQHALTSSSMYIASGASRYVCCNPLYARSSTAVRGSWQSYW